jgi:hypothetical protein
MAMPLGAAYRENNSSTFTATTGIPEPASLTLLGLGVAGIAGYAWRRRR